MSSAQFAANKAIGRELEEFIENTLNRARGAGFGFVGSQTPKSQLKRLAAVERFSCRKHGEHVVTSGVDELTAELAHNLPSTIEAEVSQGLGKSDVVTGRERALDLIPSQPACLL